MYKQIKGVGTQIKLVRTTGVIKGEGEGEGEGASFTSTLPSRLLPLPLLLNFLCCTNPLYYFINF